VTSESFVKGFSLLYVFFFFYILKGRVLSSLPSSNREGERERERSINQFNTVVIISRLMGSISPSFYLLNDPGRK